jgi:hypothetical protein
MSSFWWWQQGHLAMAQSAIDAANGVSSGLTNNMFIFFCFEL